MLSATVNSDNRNRINSYWVRKQNRIKSKSQMVSNQSHLNIMRKKNTIVSSMEIDEFLKYNLKK